ncbi:MAG: GNAT family N-acetyltransferase [Acidimicrobiia bacterium]|nr:GNAT family N-acetyltransferase [Acidimicrobiia bacterium]
MDRPHRRVQYVIVVEEAHERDVPSIVSLHAEAFPDSFLTSLGGLFLDWYYRSIVSSPNGICLVAIDGGIPIGFVAGRIEPGGNTGFAGLTKLVPFAARLAVSHPIRLAQLGRRFLWQRREAETLVEADSELTSLGSSRQRRGEGIGRKLVKAFASSVEHAGKRTISLTTDFDQNDEVRSFYESLGFVVATRFDRDRTMVQYIAAIDQIL